MRSVRGEVQPGLAQHYLHYKKAVALGCPAAMLWAEVQSDGVAEPRVLLSAADPRQASPSWSPLCFPWKGAAGLPSAVLCRWKFYCSMVCRDLWCSASAETLIALSRDNLMISCGDFLFNMPLDSHNCVLYLEAVPLLKFALQLPLKEVSISLLLPGWFIFRPLISSHMYF